ncbi:MAG: ABC transporter permease [Candidatus Methanofastidiosia archaeon]
MGPILEGLTRAIHLILFLDPELFQITFLSLRISGTAVAIAVLLSFPLSTFLSFKDFFGKKFIVNLVHTLMGLPPVVVGLVVYLLLSRKGFFGGLDLLYTPNAMIIAQLLMAIPVITGVSFAAIQGVGREIRETALSLGATELQSALTLLKEARFGLITAIIAGFGAAISEVGAIIIVGGNVRFHTRALTTAIVLETRKGNFEMAMALGIVLLSLSFVVNLLLTLLQQRGVRR